MNKPIPASTKPNIQGFRDPRWAVRNSALMVFGALVNAAVGSGKNALGSSAGGEGGPKAQPR